MKVLLFCCKGFEMMEFAPFYDVIGWAKSEYGFDVELETCGFSHTVPSAFWNTEIKVDKIINKVCVNDYDALPIGKSGVLKGRKATTYHLMDGYRQKQLPL